MLKKYQKKNIEKLLESFAGGVIMDVTKGMDAYTAQEAGAVAVMALYRVPSDIREEGGVARTAPIDIIEEIIGSVSIPVMAKVRIGHYEEARILEALGIDFIDESEVLTPADKEYHIGNKGEFKAPFVCGARDLGEALRRINEGAMMIRTKGEAGTGDVSHAIDHMRIIRKEIAELVGLWEYNKFLIKEGKKGMEDELRRNALKEYGVPYELVCEVAESKKLPVLNFAAGGIATPADAAYMMELGANGVFVGSAIFKSDDPDVRAKAIVEAVRYWNNPAKLLEVSRGLGEEMKGTAIDSLKEEDKMQGR